MAEISAVQKAERMVDWKVEKKDNYVVVWLVAMMVVVTVAWKVVLRVARMVVKKDYT